MINLLVWIKAKWRHLKFSFVTSFPGLLFNNGILRNLLLETRLFFKKPFPYNSQYITDMKQRITSAGNQFHIGSEHPLFSGYISHVLSMNNIRTCLEVGYQCGGLTIPSAKALIEKNKNTTYFGLDKQDDANSKGNHRFIFDYLKEKGVDVERIHLYIGDANELIETCFSECSADFFFDMVIIDHAKPLYQPCFELLDEKALISEESIIFFHDIFTYARKEWNSLKNIPGYYWIEIPLIDGGLGLAMKRT